MAHVTLLLQHSLYQCTLRICTLIIFIAVAMPTTCTTFQVNRMYTVHTLLVIHCTLQTVYCISFYSTLHYTLLLLYAYKLLVQI